MSRINTITVPITTGIAIFQLDTVSSHFTESPRLDFTHKYKLLLFVASGKCPKFCPK